LVGNGEADFLVVEDPSGRAFQADLVVPVPGSAAGIGWLGVVGVREEAGALLEVVALVAGLTGTAGIVGLAVVRNGHADLLVVENPQVGAL